jgi:hypothetical protein
MMTPLPLPRQRQAGKGKCAPERAIGPTAQDVEPRELLTPPPGRKR